MTSVDELIYRQASRTPSGAFGPVPAVVARLLAWTQAQPEYADVAQMLLRKPFSACPR